MKRLFTILLIASGIVTASAQTISPITQYNDINKIGQEYYKKEATWFEGNSIRWDVYARDGRNALDLSAVTMPILFVAAETNHAQVYISYTGTVVNATNGHVRISVPPESALLDPTNAYSAWIVAVSISGDTTNEVATIAYNAVTILPSIFGQSFTYIPPQSNVFSFSYSEVMSGTDDVARAWAVGASNRADAAFALASNDDTDTVARAWIVAASGKVDVVAADLTTASNSLQAQIDGISTSGNIGAVTNDPISIFANDRDFQSSTQVAASVAASQVGASNAFVKKSGDTMTGDLMFDDQNFGLQGSNLFIRGITTTGSTERGDVTIAGGTNSWRGGGRLFLNAGDSINSNYTGGGIAFNAGDGNYAAAGDFTFNGGTGGNTNDANAEGSDFTVTLSDAGDFEIITDNLSLQMLDSLGTTAADRIAIVGNTYIYGDLSVTGSITGIDNLTSTNVITAKSFTGSGESITAINAANLTAGSTASAINGANITNLQVAGVGSLYDDSTGIYTGGVLAVDIGTNTYSYGAGFGQVADYTDVDNPIITRFTWPASGTLTNGNITSNLITFVSIDASTNVVLQSTPWPAEQRRTTLPLGVLVHVNKSSHDAVNVEASAGLNPVAQLGDLMDAIGFINVSGNVFSGTNLVLNKSAGELFNHGINYENDYNDPHLLSMPLQTNIYFQYRFSDGSNGATTNQFDPANLDDGAGGLTPLANNTKWGVQRVYLFTSGNVKLQRGQTEYDTQAEAVAGASTEAFVTEASIAANGSFRGWIVHRKNTTDLSDPASATFLAAGKFGDSSRGGGGSTFSDTGATGIVVNAFVTNATYNVADRTFTIEGPASGGGGAFIDTVQNNIIPTNGNNYIYRYLYPTTGTLQFAHSVIGGGAFNSMSNSASLTSTSIAHTIAGGVSNKIILSASNSDNGHTISGGENNTIFIGSGWCGIGSGKENSVDSGATGMSGIFSGDANSIADRGRSFIGGGVENSISGSSTLSAFIGGGGLSTISGNKSYDGIGWGSSHTISANGSGYNSILGQTANTISGASTKSAILGASHSTINASTNTVIIQGSNQSVSESNLARIGGTLSVGNLIRINGIQSSFPTAITNTIQIFQLDDGTNRTIWVQNELGISTRIGTHNAEGDYVIADVDAETGIMREYNITKMFSAMTNTSVNSFPQLRQQFAANQKQSKRFKSRAEIEVEEQAKLIFDKAIWDAERQAEIDIMASFRRLSETDQRILTAQGKRPVTPRPPFNEQR